MPTKKITSTVIDTKANLLQLCPKKKKKGGAELFQFKPQAYKQLFIIKFKKREDNTL